MSVVRNMLAELREKRLWPVAAALVIALIAVPVLLSGGAKPAPPAPASLAGSSSPALPAVNVTTTPITARLTGQARNPFTQQVSRGSGTGSSTTGSAATTTGTATTGTSTTPATGGPGGSSGSGGSTTTGTTTSTAATPAPAPSGLTPTQSTASRSRSPTLPAAWTRSTPSID